MDIIGVSFIFLCSAFSALFILSIRKLWQSSTGLLVVFEKRCFYVCRYTADDFLGPWSAHILDRKGKVFLADGDKIRRLKKRELWTCLSKGESAVVVRNLDGYTKICVVRDHKLADQVREKLSWEDRMRGNWPTFPDSSGVRKDEIIAG